MSKPGEKEPQSLIRWIWFSYLKTALIPLVVVEMAFISIYFISNHWSQQEMVRFLTQEVSDEIHQVANRESGTVEKQLTEIQNAVKLFSAQTADALNSPAPLSAADAKRLSLSPDGVYYTTADRPEGSVAVFYSGAVSVGGTEKDKVARLLQNGNFMKNLQTTHPLAASVYFNTFDSLNIIYPYFDVLSQYAVHMDIPKYNFYYEADGVHNPKREVKWTGAYLDPAGHGWMTSAIAPVYRGDFLEGVVGIDVTIETITQAILNMNLPWEGYGILVGNDGAILALPTQGEAEWGLKELTNHHYEQAVTENTFKPDAFNLYKRKEFSGISDKISKEESGTFRVTIGGNQKFAAWSTIPQTGWKLLILVPENAVFSNVKTLQGTVHRIGNFMIMGLVFFYLIFFTILFYKAKAMSENLAKPLRKINEMVHSIGKGQYLQSVEPQDILELQETAESVVFMGHQMGLDKENLLMARDSAEKASRAKSQFLSSMSHELRTPLNSVLGFAHVLEMDPEAPLVPSQKECVHEIVKAGSHLLELINEVLDLARIESGKLSISMEPVQVRLVAQEAMALVKPIADQRQIDIRELSDACGSQYIMADRIRLKQVITNLLTNAIKYNKPGGYVEICCGQEGEKLRVAVQDNGRGIDPVELEHIFKPFQRGKTETEAIEGTGIGLTVSKQLAELMGGEIGVESTLGVGSKFWVSFSRIPYVEPESLPNPILALNSESVATEGVILYIEDNQANLNLMKRIMLRLPGQKLLMAKDGESGIALAKEARPDLILMDLNLPGITGYEVLERLSVMPETQDIPVIAVSANAMPQDIERGLEAGFKKYITKPIVVDDFIQTITPFLKKTED